MAEAGQRASTAELQSSGGDSALACAAETPDPANVVVETVKNYYILRYNYLAAKDDQVSWTMEKEANGFYIIFAVKRCGSDKVAFWKKSKLIELCYYDILKKKSEKSKTKGSFSYYEVKLMKIHDFSLELYFRPDIPSGEHE